MPLSDQSYSEPRVHTVGFNVARAASAELSRAQGKFGPMASPHEAYAVILEELDEFWEAVKTKGVSREDARDELIQIAAMAMRAIVDCYGDLDLPFAAEFR